MINKELEIIRMEWYLFVNLQVRMYVFISKSGFNKQNNNLIIVHVSNTVQIADGGRNGGLLRSAHQAYK